MRHTKMSDNFLFCMVGSCLISTGRSYDRHRNALLISVLLRRFEYLAAAQAATFLALRPSGPVSSGIA
jgi:hypothetical protein